MVASGEKLYVPYVMPEFPTAGGTVQTLLALQRGGASLIELGFPHSDPLADGVVIQNAAQIAIRNGATLQRIFNLVKNAREGKSGEALTVPLVLMGYINPVLAYGVEKFLDDAASAGVDGFIIPDLPPEEAAWFRAECVKRNLSVIFLISPVSSDERIKKIDDLSTDFSYCVAVNATTGTAKLMQKSDDAVEAYLERVRRQVKKKFVVGFGVQTAAQAERLLEKADGVVVGTALLKAMASATSPDETAKLAEQFWKALQVRTGATELEKG